MRLVILYLAPLIVYKKAIKVMLRKNVFAELGICLKRGNHILKICPVNSVGWGYDEPSLATRISLLSYLAQYST